MWGSIGVPHPKAPFSIANTPRCREECNSFPWIYPFNLYLIMLSVKLRGIKNHFLSLWYDWTWDWTLVSWTIGEYSTQNVTLSNQWLCCHHHHDVVPLHGYPWSSLATLPYHSSPLVCLQGYIPYPHIVAVCMFELVILLLLSHMRGSIGVHHWWVRLCFSSSVLHVWFVWLV